MADIEQRLQNLGRELEQLRDETKLKMHLANTELKDEWEELGKNLEKYRAKARQVGGATREAGEDLGEALELLGEELKKSYQRIRRAL